MRSGYQVSSAITRVVRLFALALICACTVAADGGETIAQSVQLRQPTTAFVTGAVAEYANGRLEVLTDTGQIFHALVNPRTKIALLKPAEFSDLQEGVYIASTGHDKGNDTVEASDVRIVEEKMRGIGEGVRPFHGGADAATTLNAKVVSVSTGEGAPEVNVRLRGRDMKIILANNAPILFQTVGDATALKPRVPVSIFTVRSRTGTTDAIRVNVGLNGVIPQ